MHVPPQRVERRPGPFLRMVRGVTLGQPSPTPLWSSKPPASPLWFPSYGTWRCDPGVGLAPFLTPPLRLAPNPPRTKSNRTSLTDLRSNSNPTPHRAVMQIVVVTIAEVTQWSFQIITLHVPAQQMDPEVPWNGTALLTNTIPR